MSEPSASIAVPAALAAAGSFGLAAALQHRQAQLTPAASAVSPRLLMRLAGRPLWLAGIGLAAAAFGLQALALSYGPLALVAPIVATDLLFALPIAARWSGRPFRPAQWAACALTAGAVGAFLAASPPAPGRSDGPASRWLLACAAMVLTCLVAAAAGSLAGGAARAGMLAAAAGVTAGLAAAVTLSFSRLVADAGFLPALGHWQPWALAGLGTTELLLSQGAYQASSLTASLPIIDTVEPVSGVVFGVLIFGERLATSGSGMAVQAVAGIAAIVGIALLSGRASTPGPAATSCHPAGSPAGRVAGHR